MMAQTTPWGLRWRSNAFFILSTVTVGLFSDLFLYGLIVPIVPFILSDRLGLGGADIQTYTSLLLAVFAAASLIFSPIAGFIADSLPSRKGPFVVGLTCLFISTLLTALGNTLWLLVIARILGGISGAVVWVVGTALVIDTVGPDKLGAVMGPIFSIIGVGELMSPVVGGIVYDKVGSLAVFSMGFALIAVDAAMRLLVIEKKIALGYGIFNEDHDSRESNEDLDEMASLLSKSDTMEKWRIPENQPKLIQKLPILYCLTDSRFLAALSTTLMQSTLYGVFDSTLPTEAIQLFDVNSTSAGLIFVPLLLPGLIFGPLGGRAIDKYGTKPLAVIGFAFIVAPLIALRIPQRGGTDEIVKLCIILSFISCGFAMFGAVNVVETSHVVSQYHQANPDFFGEQGPYGQTYAMGSLTFSVGLTLGPMIAGGLREKIGYGNMNAVVAAMCAATSVSSYLYVGVKPEWMKRKRWWWYWW